MSTSLAMIRETAMTQQGRRVLVGGRWLEWDGPAFDQLNPATNDVTTSVADVGRRGVDLAVSAARKAFDDGPWPRMSAQDRKRILQSIIERIYAAGEELSYLQTIDNGVPFHQSRLSRISGRTCADIFDHYAGWVDKLNGETYPMFSAASNVQHMTFREPIGVVGAILAWNAPLTTFAHKVAPALACGNTVVAKPSEYTNLAVTRLAESFAESDLPPGVLNLVTGGAETGSALATHPGVDKVSFTGSPGVGEKIMSTAGANMKRLSLELGGKSAGIVFADARSVEASATTLMAACSTFLSGQACVTSSRAIVHKSIVREFIHHAREQAGSVRFGDPFDPLTTSAPIISRKQLSRILGYVESGKQQGAELVFGGDTPGGDLARGNWVNPTLFANVDNTMKIAREEIFGPVLSVITFETEEEAVRLANDSEYGLAGTVFTIDVSRAFRVARAIRSGAIGINGYAGAPNAPMGGIKRSGVGREGGWPGIEAYSELKTVDFNIEM